MSLQPFAPDSTLSRSILINGSLEEWLGDWMATLGLKSRNAVLEHIVRHQEVLEPNADDIAWLARLAYETKHELSRSPLRINVTQETYSKIEACTAKISLHKRPSVSGTTMLLMRWYGSR